MIKNCQCPHAGLFYLFRKMVDKRGCCNIKLSAAAPVSKIVECDYRLLFFLLFLPDLAL